MSAGLVVAKILARCYIHYTYAHVPCIVLSNELESILIFVGMDCCWNVYLILYRIEKNDFNDVFTNATFHYHLLILVLTSII